MGKDFSVQAAFAGVLAGFVGFSSSFAVVLQGVRAQGASPAEAATALMALSIAMGVCGLILSLASRLPISVAWTTPGAALLASSAGVAGGFPAAVGAFLVCGCLLLAVGWFRPFARLVAAIPAPLANAMLAGVLLGLCLAPVKAAASIPHYALPVIVVWALVARWRRVYALPAAVVTAIAFILFAGAGVSLGGVAFLAAPTPVRPVFTPAAIIGIALPLFIVTMASQNIPGLAVLAANGYRPDPAPLLRATGFFSILSAPFGAPAVNLAAITAALCAGPEAHPDPARRYWAAAVAGAFYIVIGLSAGLVMTIVAAAPPLLIEAVAGLALLGAFASSTLAAVQGAEDREAAVVTFLVAASGVTILGVGGAFWGLLAGGALRALTRWRRA